MSIAAPHKILFIQNNAAMDVEGHPALGGTFSMSVDVAYQSPVLYDRVLQHPNLLYAVIVNIPISDRALGYIVLWLCQHSRDAKFQAEFFSAVKTDYPSVLRDVVLGARYLDMTELHFRTRCLLIDREVGLEVSYNFDDVEDDAPRRGEEPAVVRQMRAWFPE